jgi:hypothetical protein
MQLSEVDLKKSWLVKKGWEAVMFLLPFSFPFLSLICLLLMVMHTPALLIINHSQQQVESGR